MNTGSFAGLQKSEISAALSLKSDIGLILGILHLLCFVNSFKHSDGCRMAALITEKPCADQLPSGLIFCPAGV
jgi:hypothetical protein